MKMCWILYLVSFVLGSNYQFQTLVKGYPSSPLTIKLPYFTAPLQTFDPKNYQDRSLRHKLELLS